MRLRNGAPVAGVVGRPIVHSLSPLLHNSWLKAAGASGYYVPFSPAADRFAPFVEGLRGGVIRGLNVTLPFKEEALRLADTADVAARAAGAANLLLFDGDGRIEARNTDGVGLLAAFEEQAPMFHVKHGPVVILGAGGAARGAAATLNTAGCPALRIVNRTRDRGEALADEFGAEVFDLGHAAAAFDGANAIINATSAGLAGNPPVAWPLGAAPEHAVIMDMVYAPLATDLLKAARARGLRAVDGLAMLIGQARPSYEAFFGEPPPINLDVRTLLIRALGEEA